MIDYSYIGSGKIYLRDLNGTGGLMHIGNCSKLDFVPDEETKTLVDYTSPGGGALNEVRRIKGVGLSMTLHNLSPENVAMALYGKVSAVQAGEVLAEEAVARKGALIRLSKPNPSSVVVKDESGENTYEEVTDYEVSPGGIFIPAASTIVEGSTIKITYDYGAFDLVQAFDSAAGEYEMFFEGLNEARSGKPVLVDVWRSRFGAASNVGFIGQDFAELSVEGKVLKDTAKAGSISQYFQVTFVQ